MWIRCVVTLICELNLRFGSGSGFSSIELIGLVEFVLIGFNRITGWLTYSIFNKIVSSDLVLEIPQTVEDNK